VRTIIAGTTGIIRSVHRIATTCIALSATAVLVPGCGGSGRASSSNPGSPVTKAQAAAYADAVNLREADLGWERLRPGGEVKVSRPAVAFSRCGGGVDPHRWVVLTYSTRYGKTGEASAGSMQSNVLVMPMAALAVEDAQAMLSARGFGCFARGQARATIRTASGKVIRRGRGTVTRLASPLPGVADSFEWRTTWTRVLPARRPKGPSHIVHAVFLRRPARVPRWSSRGRADFLQRRETPAHRHRAASLDGDLQARRGTQARCSDMRSALYVRA
jgi:hypothetical protein